MTGRSNQDRRRGALCGRLGLGLVALILGAAAHVAAARADVSSLPPIRHVWVIVEENASFADNGLEMSFDPKVVPYLGNVLTQQGNLLTRYYGIAHNSQANYIAMISGQSPTPGSQSDGIACAENTSSALNEIPSGAPVDHHGQIVGQGCMYPAKVKTLADQFEANGLTWKGYMQNLGASTATSPGLMGRCPVGNLNGSTDPGHGDSYARKHDPFQFFHSIIDVESRCLGKDVPLTDLARDLQSVRTTPNFSFVVPGLFSDGHDGERAANEDPWLRQYVPMIMSSPAYRQDGMILIVFDEAGTFVGVDTSTNREDSDACCHEIPGPNSAMPGISGLGGGRTGALVLSPFAKPGTLDDPADNPLHAGLGFYNQYSLLRSMEDLFGIDQGGDDGHGHLGFAGNYLDYPGPGSFGPDVYNGYDGHPAGPAVSGAAPGSTGPRAADGSTAWQNPLPQSNDLNGVSCPTSEACFAVGDGGAILTSSDGGDSWSLRRSGTADDLRAISCGSASACVAVGNARTALTTADAGATWSSHASGTQGPLSGVSCASASTCVAVGDGGTVLRSDDGGASWRSGQSGTSEPLYGVSCPTAEVCYAVGRSNTIVKSDDSGASWAAKAAADVKAPRLWAVSCADTSTCVAAGDSGVIWRTVDGGAKWSSQQQLQANAAYPSLRGASCPGAQACFLAGEVQGNQGNGGLFKPDIAALYATTNGGGAWTRQTTHSSNLLHAVSCPTPTRCVAVGMRGSILRSADGGAGWSSRTPGTEGDLSRVLCVSQLQQQCLTDGVNALRGVSFPDVNTGFAVGSFRTVMATGDGGAHWSTQTSGAPHFDPAVGRPPVPPPDLNAIACPSAPSCVAVGDVGSIVTTGDGGGSWSDRTSGTQSDLLGVTCPAASFCYAVGSRGTILKSSDAGQSWGKLNSGTDGLLSAISCADTSTCVAVGGVGTILLTTNGGNHWSSGNSGTSSYLAAVSCVSVDFCVAVGSGGTVLRITRAGTQVSARPSGIGDELMSVSCATKKRCMATGSLGTVISTGDGGTSWNVQGTGTPRALRAASCPSSDRCVAAGDAAAILAVAPPAKPGGHQGGGKPR